jgi:hypothetical protein
LQGKVYERDGFEDGVNIIISSAKELDLQNNIARTRNSEYILGKLSEEYLKWLDSNGLKLNEVIE